MILHLCVGVISVKYVLVISFVRFLYNDVCWFLPILFSCSVD